MNAKFNGSLLLLERHTHATNTGPPERVAGRPPVAQATVSIPQIHQHTPLAANQVAGRLPAGSSTELLEALY